MLKSRERIKNPLLRESGRKAAWYLFAELNYPFNDFEKFRRILWAAIVRSPWLYSTITIAKRSGGRRILQIPHPDLMTIQRAVNKNILEPLDRHRNVYGFSGGGVKEAALAIAKADQAVFTTDVKDAFPSTSGRAVFNFFKSKKYGYYASYYLTCLTTWFNQKKKGLPAFGLPQGAPTSPRLFDFCFEPFDYELSELAKNIRGTYVRYADNIFITAPEFWPETKKRHIERGEERPDDPSADDYFVKPAGQEDIEKYRGCIVWHAPVISAVFRIAKRGYELKEAPDPDGWWQNKGAYYQRYYLHKSYFARRGHILHTLGLNVVDGQVRNTRKFKLRLRLTIFNLKKALEQKDDFETKIWPLYLKLSGMQCFIIRETAENLWQEVDAVLYDVFLIRYSGEAGTYVKNIGKY